MTPAVGEFAGWLALLLAAWNAGRSAARWQRDPARLTRSDEWSVFACASLVALSWAALGGAFLRGDRGLGAVADRLVIDAPASYRLAAMATGVRAGCVTAALLLALAMLVTLGGGGRHERWSTRRLTLHSGVLGVMLAISTLVFPPFANGEGRTASADLALNLLHPGAAIAPWLTLGSLVFLVVGGCACLATFPAPGPVTSADEGVRRSLVSAWLLASFALAADQWARSALTASSVAGNDARNAGGLVLWLVSGAVLHRRIRQPLLSRASRTPHAAVPAAAGDVAARLVHLGAVLIVVAFTAHVVAARHEVTLEPGRAATVRDVFGRTWRLVNQGISRFDTDGHEVAALAVEVTRPGGARQLMSSELRAYLDSGGEPVETTITATAVRRGVLQDFLLTLESVESGDRARAQAAFVPLTSLWLLGVLLLAGGGVLALSRRPRARAEAAG